jgi:hypothetical protein
MVLAAISISDVLVVVLPPLGALAGAYLGVRWQSRSQADRELRGLVDSAAGVLARADQARGAAYVQFVQEGTNTSDRGVEVVQSYRKELSEADQIRYRIAVRTKPGDPIHQTFDQTLAALGDVSIALGTAVALPPDSARDLSALHDRMTKGEQTFNEERDAFLAAARTRFG